jgi:hypothetical protein
MDHSNAQPDQPEPQRPMNSTEVSNAFQMIMTELNALRNQINTQDERLQQGLMTIRTELLNTPATGPSMTGTPNPDSLTPPAPPVQTIKSERLPDPEKFTGKREELRPFLAQLKNKLEGNADRYPTEPERLRYALSRVAGDAAITIETFEPTSVAAFIEILKTSYGDPNRQATAQQKLNRMTQSDQSFPTYFARFHQYSKETGWNDAAQINHLVESLNPELKRTLVGVILPTRLEDCANLINRHYNDLRRLQPRAAHKTSATTATTTTTTAATQPQKKDPDTMDLSPGTQGYAPKNSAERQKRIREGRCFKCGSKGHLSPNCSVPIARTGLAIADSRPPSPLSLPGGVSLNELPQE